MPCVSPIGPLTMSNRGIAMRSPLPALLLLVVLIPACTQQSSPRMAKNLTAIGGTPPAAESPAAKDFEPATQEEDRIPVAAGQIGQPPEPGARGGAGQPAGKKAAPVERKIKY